MKRVADGLNMGSKEKKIAVQISDFIFGDSIYWMVKTRRARFGSRLVLH